jgi:hypothetical protein
MMMSRAFSDRARAILTICCAPTPKRPTIGSKLNQFDWFRREADVVDRVGNRHSRGWANPPRWVSTPESMRINDPAPEAGFVRRGARRLAKSKEIRAAHLENACLNASKG